MNTDEVIPYCRNCSNDYKLQLLGNYANGVEYMCPDCFDTWIEPHDEPEALKEANQ